MIFAVESTWSFGYARVQTLDCKFASVIVFQTNATKGKGITRAALRPYTPY